MSSNRQSDIIVPSAQNIIFCAVLLLLLWTGIFLPATYEAGVEAEESLGSYFFSKITEFVSPYSVLARVAALFIFAFICFVLQKLNEEFAFIRVRTILPPLLFIVIGSLLLPHAISPALIITLLLVLSLYAAFLSANSLNPIQCFNIALLMSLASLLSFPAITMILLFLLFLFSCNQLDLRGVIATGFGMIIPYIYVTIAMAINGDLEILANHVTSSIGIFDNEANYTTIDYAYLGILMVSFLTAMFHFSFGSMLDNLKQRKEMQFIIGLFVWVVLMMLIGIPTAEHLIGCACLLYAIIIGRFFSVEDTKLSKILFALLAVASVVKLFF